MLGLDWLINPGVLGFLAKGLGVSLVIAVAAGAIGFALGAVLAAGRLSKRRLISAPATLYIETVRSIPVLLLVFFVFFALNPMLALDLNPFLSGTLALSAFNGAIAAEIIRAGIQSVDRGLIEAARAQALSPWQIFRLIQMPLALRRMTPALVTQFISLVKSTSLLVVIGVPEFLSRAVVVTSHPPFETVPVYVLVAFTYFIVNYSLSCVGSWLERLETGGMRVGRS